MKRTNIFIFSMLMIALYGCNDLEYNSEYVPSPAKLFLTVDTENFDFSPNATSGYFNINAGRNYWRIENNVSWLQLSTEQGYGPWGIELSVKRNDSSEKDRACIINVKSDEGNWYTCIPILVHQAKADPYISIGEYDYVVSGFSHAIDIDVRANIDWTVSSDETWAVVGTSGSSRNRITVYMTPNTTRESRKVNITFHGIVSKMITITQRPLNITSSAVSLSYGHKGGEQTLDIKTDAYLTTQTSADWINVKTVSGNDGTGRITVSTDENDSDNPRTDFVYVHTNDSNTFEITVSQECDNLHTSIGKAMQGNDEKSNRVSIDKSDEWSTDILMNMDCKASDTELSFNSSSMWTANVDSSADWITVSPAEGDGNGVVNIAVDDNTSLSARSAKIYLIAKDSFIYIINVTQQGCGGSR